MSRHSKLLQGEMVSRGFESPLDKGTKSPSNKIVDLSQSNLLIVCGLVVILVVTAKALVRKSNRAFNSRSDNSQTNSSASRSSSPSGVSASAVSVSAVSAPARPAGWDNYRPRRTRVVLDDDPAITGDQSPLAIHFNWNGHSWEAYEVFGLPPGCSLEVVKSAFEKVSAKADADSQAFLLAAYTAILKSPLNASAVTNSSNS